MRNTYMFERLRKLKAFYTVHPFMKQSQIPALLLPNLYVGT